MKNILIITGSPKKNGNTSLLVDWFIQGADSDNTAIALVNAASLRYKVNGCTSCRGCQKLDENGCTIKDGVSDVLKKMTAADIIAMASPMYFFGASAQLKAVFDRMFSLYKWNNNTNTYTSPLQGKTFLCIGSAYEALGIDTFEQPFRLTAEYTQMSYDSLMCLMPGYPVTSRAMPMSGKKLYLSAGNTHK